MLPVNIDKAEYIISLSTKNNAGKSMLAALKEIKEQINKRQKFNKTYYQVSNIIEENYSKRLYTNQQLMKRIKFELNQLNHQIDQFIDQRAASKQQQELYENELAEIRQYAEQRRNKKAKRERQYHQLYHVPIVAQQFKKKYVRARDKNSDAEQQVSDIRSKVDTCQQEISTFSKSITDAQKQMDQYTAQTEEIERKLAKHKELIFELQEGRKFIQSFDQYQLIDAQKATTQLIDIVPKQQLMDPNQDYVKYFKLALFEYGKAEKYMDNRWGRLCVQFDCSKCERTHHGWPKLDKVRTKHLLCDSCYQDNHSSMVFEKKVKEQFLNLPTSTVETKPGFKKIVKMFKTTNAHVMMA